MGETCVGAHHSRTQRPRQSGTGKGAKVESHLKHLEHPPPHHFHRAQRQKAEAGIGGEAEGGRDGRQPRGAPEEGGLVCFGVFGWGKDVCWEGLGGGRRWTGRAASPNASNPTYQRTHHVQAQGQMRRRGHEHEPPQQLVELDDALEPRAVGGQEAEPQPEGGFGGGERCEREGLFFFVLE